MFYNKPLPDILFQDQLYKVFARSKELFICLYSWFKKWATVPNRTRILLLLLTFRWLGKWVLSFCRGCPFSVLDVFHTLLTFTLYPSAAHSVPPEGDLYAVHPQASFSPASSLVGQWRTQQVTQGRRRMKLECNPIYPLTQFMPEPSPHSPLGLWFQGKCYFPSFPQTSERQHLSTRLFLALGHSIILCGIPTHNVIHNLFIKLSSDYSIWKASLSCQHAHWYNKVTGGHLLATQWKRHVCCWREWEWEYVED